MILKIKTLIMKLSKICGILLKNNNISLKIVLDDFLRGVKSDLKPIK